MLRAFAAIATSTLVLIARDETRFDGGRYSSGLRRQRGDRGQAGEGVVGAALTDRSQIDLGEPVWKRGGPRRLFPG